MHEHALISDLMRQILKTAESEKATAVVGVVAPPGVFGEAPPAAVVGVEPPVLARGAITLLSTTLNPGGSLMST